ncbi:hypothetical protein GW17_00059008 [Ensete ventricosum]|nr:hypothetical protein GW17_00059008 [Ensete ventricosum]
MLRACRRDQRLAGSLLEAGREYQKLAGSSRELTEGDRELARMVLGSSLEEDQETCRKIVEGSQKAYREGNHFFGIPVVVPRAGDSCTAQIDDCTATAQYFGQLSMVVLLAPMVVPPMPGFFGYDCILALFLISIGVDKYPRFSCI